MRSFHSSKILGVYSGYNSWSQHASRYTYSRKRFNILHVKLCCNQEEPNQESLGLNLNNILARQGCELDARMSGSYS